MIELIIVVAIIAVIAAIAIPNLIRARKVANATICQARLRELSQGIILYGQDYPHRWPNVGDWRDPVNLSTGVLEGYVNANNPNTFKCPSDFGFRTWGSCEGLYGTSFGYPGRNWPKLYRLAGKRFYITVAGKKPLLWDQNTWHTSDDMNPPKGTNPNKIHVVLTDGTFHKMPYDEFNKIVMMEAPGN